MRSKLSIKLVAFLLLCLLFVLPVSAKSVEELIRLASTDLIPEIRAAASLALAELLVTSDHSDQQLEDMAASGLSLELREAAARALGTRLVEKAADLEELIDLAVSHPLKDVRQAASEALGKLLPELNLGLEELRQIAVDGATVELRQAAVEALVQALFRSSYAEEELVALSTSGGSAELRIAAAKALSERLLASKLIKLQLENVQPIVEGKSTIFNEVIHGKTPELRTAVIGPLVEKASSYLSVEELISIAGNPANTTELRSAAGIVLSRLLPEARRFSLTQLIDIARDGATSELRASTREALRMAIIEAVGEGKLSLAGLVARVQLEESEELSDALAAAIFALLHRHLSTPAGRDLLERCLRRETIQVEQVALDCSLAYFRKEASAQLAQLYKEPGILNFNDPLADLMGIATDTNLTSEFRAAAGKALVKFFKAQRGRTIGVIGELKAILNDIDEAAKQGRFENAWKRLLQFKENLDSNWELIVITAEAAGNQGIAGLLHTVDDEISYLKKVLQERDTSETEATIAEMGEYLDEIEKSLKGAPDTTRAELECYAGYGATSELRGAAEEALKERLVHSLKSGEISLEYLYNLALAGRSNELRGAAVEALSEALSGSDKHDFELWDMVLGGETTELRAAAAKALINRKKPHLDLASLLQLANGEEALLRSIAVKGETPEIRASFGESLVNFLKDLSIHQLEDMALWGKTPELRAAAGAALRELYWQMEKPLEELIAIAGNGGSPELRAAAGEALTKLLIDSNIGESQLIRLAVQYSQITPNAPGTSSELSLALSTALADRFKRGTC